MADTISVTRTISVEASPQRVWEILASPAQWPGWMLLAPEVEPGQSLQLGSKFAWLDEAGAPYLHGTVTQLEPAAGLTLELRDRGWSRPARPGEVTYTFSLAPEGNGTRLDFALGDLSIDAGAEQWRSAYAEAGELEAIKRIAETA